MSLGKALAGSPNAILRKDWSGRSHGIWLIKTVDY